MNVTFSISIYRVVNSAGKFFADRSASFVLDTVTHDSSAAVSGHLVQLLKDKSFNQPHQKPHPLLHLTVTMAPSSFATVQLLQTPKHLTLDQEEVPSNVSLKEVAKHSSLLVCYATGMGLDALLETASEFQETLHNKSRGKDDGNKTEEGEDERGNTSERGTKAKTKIDSFKLSADFKLPVLQLAMCALVSEKTEGDKSTFPSLSQTQSQLHFQLVNLPPTTEATSRSATCVLLEAGVKESSATCVAEIVHSELSEEVVLTWRNVQGYQLQETSVQPTSDDCQEKKNRIVLSISLPWLWSQLASPNTGIAGPTTGGIDTLILIEAMEAWQRGVEKLLSSIQSLLTNKALCEKQALLMLIANAAKLPMSRKVSFHLFLFASVHM